MTEIIAYVKRTALILSRCHRKRSSRKHPSRQIEAAAIVLLLSHFNFLVRVVPVEYLQKRHGERAQE